MIPRLRFANLPTPVEPMQRLSAALGGPRLWIKRDDLTGVAFGGNKTRKLEFVLAEALANGARTLVTVGSIQSNHCRQTAAMAARLGMRCVLVLSGREPEYPTGNLLIDQLCGAEIVWCTYPERDDVLKRSFEKEWVDGKRPYLIPLGASNGVLRDML
jgi:1-aminocyclopropane-1-carboxylate deaminase/D-cysteine desulfhydrase-like pyridoxal-dependent ACC family enzyme